MGVTGIMNVGIHSLSVYETALDIASQNMAHADEPNYSRREVDFSENPFYMGVKIGDIRRVIDEAAQIHLQQANSELSEMDTYLQQFQLFEPTFDTPSTSISKYISNAKEALSILQSTASSAINRGLYMDKLANVVSRFQSVSNEITNQKKSVNSSLSGIVEQVNNLLNGIAKINQNIPQGVAENKLPLLDQRDGLIQKLAQYFNFTTQTDSNGVINVSLSNGIRLVSGTVVTELTTMQDPTDTANLTVGMKNGSANIQIADYIQSGQIAGWLGYREDGLETSELALNRLALIFSQTFNDQNKLGVDLNGNLGGNIFTDVNSAGMVASRSSANLNNTGTADIGVTIDDTSQLLASDYTLSVGASSAYTLIRRSDNTIVDSGTLSGPFPQTISVDGFSIVLNSGTFNSGDQYTISPTHDAASAMGLEITKDGSQLALGWPVVVSPSLQNQGAHQVIQVSSMTDTTTSAFSTTPGQLTPPVQIVFTDSTHYNLIDVTTGLDLESGTATFTSYDYDPLTTNNIFPSSYDPGYQVTLSGTMVTGDSFNVGYNSAPGGDSRNAIAMFNAYDEKTVLLPHGISVNFQDAYGLIVKDIAVKTNSAQTEYDSRATLLDQAVQWRQSISGVSLPEETMNLTRFQQSYQASAQILQAARTILETIISMTRG